MLDTICAVATARGRSGVGIVRLSGPLSAQLAQRVAGELPAARVATHRLFRDEREEPIDDGLLLYFPSPHSFTGENVIEFHGHGSPVALDLLLQCLIRLGARMARPGEFSERAFLNGKLDLAQAEAVADLIHSQTEVAARAAVRSLTGEFSSRIRVLVEQVIYLRVFVESAIDFADEEIDFLRAGEIRLRAQKVVDELQGILKQTRQGALLREGITLVVAGQPNAGKSSLLNRLAGYEAAIVTPVAGTTRDIVREHIQLSGVPITVLDTAGIRDTVDTVEQEGVRRTQQALQTADHVVLVIDSVQGYDDRDIAIQQGLPKHVPITLVFNKIDVTQELARIDQASHEVTKIWLSTRTGEGLALLTEHLTHTAGLNPEESGGFIARRRHLEALESALGSLQRGCTQFDQTCATELFAEDLRETQQHLNTITGEFTSDDLLGRIFSEFCIGK